MGVLLLMNGSGHRLGSESGGVRQCLRSASLVGSINAGLHACCILSISVGETGRQDSVYVQPFLVPSVWSMNEDHRGLNSVKTGYGWNVFLSRKNSRRNSMRQPHFFVSLDIASVCWCCIFFWRKNSRSAKSHAPCEPDILPFRSIWQLCGGSTCWNVAECSKLFITGLPPHMFTGLSNSAAQMNLSPSQR